ncbi:diuretic hormone 47 [Tribolium castaneum]|uniref:Diuretic hormone 47 n=1 Tax=Tribolium castaneum TaxID=7070 RepID=D7EJD3_TRICA|nr:diuretic hormone 47 [Tribolium castaneum]
MNKLSPESRSKRAGALGESGASLSIVNSLDVLRNRLLLEIARKKAKEGANRNRQILLSLGKRAFLQSRASGTYDNNV